MNTKSPVTRIFRRGSDWKTLVDEWQLSGSTVSEFCKEKRISKTCFYYWRNHFNPTPKQKSLKGQTNTFVPVVISSPETAASAKAILNYPNGCQLQISHIDLNTLKLLNQAMGV